MESEKKIIAYKGMNQDMTCRGYQFEVGGEYEEEAAILCKKGFHACEYPLNVFEHYAPTTSRYFQVEQSGDLKTDGEKTVSKKIKISAEIGIPGLVKAAIEYTKSRAHEEEGGCATGDYGAASSTGVRGAASSTGYQGAASSTGDYGAASSTGDYGAASSTGVRGAASSTGVRGAASSTGDYGAASSTGVRGAASSTGYQGAASSTGVRGAASATGKASVALAAGRYGKAKGSIGSAICVVERGEWDGETYPIIAVKAAIVDGKKLKADTYYTLNDGKFVEVKA